MNPTGTPTRLVSRNPHDGSVVGEVPVATLAEVTAAVAKAAAAAADWAATPFDERAALLRQAGSRLGEVKEELANLVHREMGKPLPQAEREAESVAAAVERHVDMARRAISPVTHVEQGVETLVRRDPLGVVACITPWNFPLAVPQGLVFPALLTGNAVVHKPSERTPLTGRRFTEVVASALPPGVLMHLGGAGEVGRWLVESDVQAIAFVGSQAVGRAIMAAAAPGLKRIVLELGGKDPMIVLADADLDAAADFAARGAFANSGQVCCSVERILVERSVAEDFTARLLARAREIEIGPMVDDAQRAKVAAHVEDAVAHGAHLLLGGRAPERPGSWFPPTVLTGVTDDMALAREETFGPVAAVRTVADAEEAVQIANATDYGLGATVWTADAAGGASLAGRLQAGMVGVNRGIRGVGDAPWVGARQSGFGFTGSVEGTRHFTQLRTLSRPVGR